MEKRGGLSSARAGTNKRDSKSRGIHKHKKFMHPGRPHLGGFADLKLSVNWLDEHQHQSPIFAKVMLSIFRQHRTFALSSIFRQLQFNFYTRPCLSVPWFYPEPGEHERV